jgi:hypothetical protein
MRARLGLSPAPQARRAPVPAPGPASVPARVPATPALAARQGASSGFGLRDTPRPEAVKVDHVVSRMSAYKFDRYGIFTVTLSNGQVWRQLQGDTSYAHWKKPPGTYVATISRGWFGSYNFQVRDNPGMFKVQRER